MSQPDPNLLADVEVDLSDLDGDVAEIVSKAPDGPAISRTVTPRLSEQRMRLVLAEAQRIWANTLARPARPKER
ncbi:MAG TPA: hypothetical protein VJU58_13810 [Microbacterium sp.]|nr:hypothetical protein [Microbacterium sp.]